LQTKTCQKPYAKTPQKTHKNLVRKNPAKIFYMEIKIFDRKLFFDFMHQELSQNKDIKYAMINIVTFSVMFPELKKHLKSQDDEIIINGIKIQVSKLCAQENVYFSEEEFTNL
jgi:hypothetical protein